MRVTDLVTAVVHDSGVAVTGPADGLGTGELVPVGILLILGEELTLFEEEGELDSVGTVGEGGSPRVGPASPPFATAGGLAPAILRGLVDDGPHAVTELFALPGGEVALEVLPDHAGRAGRPELGAAGAEVEEPAISRADGGPATGGMAGDGNFVEELALGEATIRRVLEELDLDILEVDVVLLESGDVLGLDSLVDLNTVNVDLDSGGGIGTERSHKGSELEKTRKLHVVDQKSEDGEVKGKVCVFVRGETREGRKVCAM